MVINYELISHTIEQVFIKNKPDFLEMEGEWKKSDVGINWAQNCPTVSLNLLRAVFVLPWLMTAFSLVTLVM